MGDHSKKSWRRPERGRFHNYRDKLLSGRSILRFGGAAFVFMFEVLSCLAAPFAWSLA